MKKEEQPKGDVLAGTSRRTHRTLTGKAPSITVTLLVVVLNVFAFLYLTGALTTARFYMDIETWLPIVFGLKLVLSIIYFPLRGKLAVPGKLPWYDIASAVIGSFAMFYVAAYWLDLRTYRIVPTPLETIWGTALILIVTVQAWRTSGPAVPIVTGLAVIYPLFAERLPGILWGPSLDWQRIVGEIWLFGEGYLGDIVKTHTYYIYPFLIMGSMLGVSGASRFFLGVATALAGRFRGGPAKVALISSALYGTMSGSAVSNVATTAVITIPLMSSVGYKPHQAAAIESVASAGGIITPPVLGNTAFIMAVFMGVPYWSLVIAASIPALLYYFSLYLQVDLMAQKQGLKGLPRESIPSLGNVFREGWEHAIPIAVLIFSLAVLHYPATMSCIFTIASLLVVPMFRKATRWKVKTLWAAIEEGTRLSVRIFPMNAAAGAMTACLTITGITQSLSGMLLQLSGGNIFILLLLVAGTCYIFGLALPALVSYILMSILVVPALIQGGLGVYPAHMFVFYYAISSVITPPVCTPVFVAAGIAGAGFMRTGFAAMRLAIVIYLVPFAFVYAPALLLQGPLTELVVPLISAIIAFPLIAFGLEGYVRSSLGWFERILLIAGGLLLLAPPWMWTLKIVGLVAGIIGLFPQGLAFCRQKRRTAVGLSAPP